MNAASVIRRVGTRTNTRASDNASWLVAVVILAMVIPASDKVASNQVFFAAHGVSPFAWVVLVVVAVVGTWLVLAGALALLRRWLSPRAFDIVVSSLMLVTAWFFVGNVAALTLLAGLPWLGPVVGLAAAIGITLLSRRAAMGSALVVFAAVAAVIPMLTTVWGGAHDATTAAFTFADEQNRPSILWVVADEMQYPLGFDADGHVRAELPNLKSLQQDATTYTHAYSGANYTDYAVPSMLTGISDVAAQGTERMQKVRASIGIVPGLASAYSVVMESPIYSFDCDTADCASVSSGAEVGLVKRYADFVKDTVAIAGRTALARPFADLFPSLDGKWRDFWSGGDEFGQGTEGNSVSKVISGIEQVRAENPKTPVFAFWHTIRTHGPWVVDRQGKEIFPFRVPIVDGAHMAGSEANQTYTTDQLKSLERRLYANSAVDFDRQLGQLIAALKADGTYDSTMIVVTADHGAGLTEHADRRMGDTLEQRWAEVAHVPLMVKAPGQTSPSVVASPRSTGQIAATVMAAAGAQPGADLKLSPDLTQDLSSGPVFTTIAGGVMTPWEYSGIAEKDPWRADDLTPPDPEHPFAIGVDPSLMAGPVPAGWREVPIKAIEAPPGESSLQLVVVERANGACAVKDTAGLVSLSDRVVGSVLWEGPRGSTDGLTRGWAIVPKAAPSAYRFWCPST